MLRLLLARNKGLAGSGAVLATLLLYAWGIEPRWVVTTHHTVGRERAGQRPVRVVQLSDLHLREIGMRERRVVTLTRSERPDLIVLTGDTIAEGSDLSALDGFLSLLGEGATVVAIPGNWEHWAGVPVPALRDVLARHGGSLLVNETISGNHDGRRWVLIGLDTPPGPVRPESGAAGPEGNRMVLVHEPTVRDHWTGPSAAAMLAGHTHGGQIALGPLAPLTPPGSGDYVSGWYRGPPVDLYVSRGIGTSTLPLRLGARPEVAVFEWWLE